MLFEVEGKAAIHAPTEAKMRAELSRLKSYGPRSFASLTDDSGNYLQVAGGGLTCLLEWRNANSGRHYRAHNEVANPVFPDGTKLAFGGGEIEMKSDEWFNISVVADLFCAFLEGKEIEPHAKWRDVTASVT